jgi:hypothetical protein
VKVFRTRLFGLRGLALRFAVPCFAACIAAVLAHLAIDVAGDYLLPEDTYDALAHASRTATTLIALVVACGVMWAILRAALAEVRGSAGALRSALSQALPGSPVRFAALVASLAAPVLLGMGALDTALAGQKIDDPSDLVGGSYVLAGACELGVSALVALAVFALIRFLCRYHRAIVRAVEHFVRLAVVGHASGLRLAHARAIRPRTLPALLRCTTGNRAPPMLRVRAILA